MEAVRHKNLGAVQCLLKHGADVNFQDSNGDTCYHLAVEKGAREMIDVLSEEGADLNLQNKNVCTIPTRRVRASARRQFCDCCAKRE